MKLSYLKLNIALVSCLLFFIAIPVFSANVFFDAKNQSFAQNEEFLAQVFLNTEEESLNAIEGRIIFPTDLLEVKEIRDGGSAINFWIEKPHSFQLGAIIFSGITPGGLLGSKEFIFSVVFNAKKEGSGAIKIDGLRVLRNDGEGTPAKIEIRNLEFKILKSEGQISSSILQIPSDIEPPENFKPTIESNSNIFDGKYFLVFATQDKISGIANYKAREGEWGWFRNVESPYLLKYQSLDRKIFVKAIDKAGNERIVVVESKYPMKWYEFSLMWIIIILGVAIYFIKRILWKKHEII